MGSSSASLERTSACPSLSVSIPATLAPGTHTMYFFEVFAAYRIPILEIRLYIDKEQEKIRVNVDNFPYAAMLKTGDMR